MVRSCQWAGPVLGLRRVRAERRGGLRRSGGRDMHPSRHDGLRGPRRRRAREVRGAAMAVLAAGPLGLGPFGIIALAVVGLALLVVWVVR